jgi:carboxymethylenebutenolidase
VLGLYGAEDPFIPLADVEEMRRRLLAAGVAAELRTYAGAGHAFFNDTRPDAHRAAAAADAWRRSIAFLRGRLTPPAPRSD